MSNEEKRRAWFDRWGTVRKGGPTSGNYGHKGIPGKHGGSAPGGGHGLLGVGAGASKDELRQAIEEYREARKPQDLAARMVNRETEKIVNEEVDQNIERVAIIESRSVEEVTKQAMNNFRNGLEQGALATMVTQSVLEKIVADGQFKNQHETGTSGGSLIPDLRARAEQSAFNIKEGAEPKDYPVYGFVNMPDSPSPTSYGAVKLILRDSIKNRTTVTLGDSLGGFSGQRIAGTPYRDPRKGSLDKDVFAAFSAKEPKDLLKRMARYVEAQIHGGIMAKDIVKIVTVGGNRFHVKAASAVAQELGVPFGQE